VPQPAGKSALRDAAALAAFVAVLHVPDFFRTIADYNEGFYAVIGREVVAGHLPYVTAWEAKPPAFFAIVALAMAVFGINFTALHLLAVAATIAIVLCVYAVGRAFARDGVWIARSAAVVTAALLLSDSGTAVEGDLLGGAFAAGGFAIAAHALRPRALSGGAAFSCGILASLAIGMKITLLPIAAVAFAAAAYACGSAALAAISCGALLPVAAQIAPFVFARRVDLLLDANLWTIFRRFGTQPAHPALAEVVRQQFEAFFPAWLLAPILPAALRATGAERDRRIVVMCAWWLGSALIAVVAIREFFGYQWTVAMPPASLLAAWITARAWQTSTARNALLAISALAVVAHAPGRWLMLREPDDFARVAAYLYTLPPSQRTSLYVASNPGIYVLADAPIPTRFALPQQLWARDMELAAGVDGYTELSRIFARPPAVVVAPRTIDARTPPAQLLRTRLARDYRAAFRSGDEVVYIRGRLFSRSSSRAYRTAVRSASLR
jgi:4-amino-4-deoxy-L-arabinose transferase-like glycosyltransferase